MRHRRRHPPLFAACAAGLWALASLAASPAHVEAQSSAPDPLVELRDDCTGIHGPTMRERCSDAALSAEALLNGLGLLAAVGGPIPASPSTAGRRIAGEPRIVVDAGLIGGSFRIPDLSRPSPDAGVRDARRLATGIRLGTAVGLFEGFSPAPSVGGVLAVDAVASFRYLRLPTGQGFDGGTAVWGGGARLGIVRESFTLPGVTASIMHHRVGTVGYGQMDETAMRAETTPRVTSIRGVVGKDLLALGVSAGAGWDRIRGESRIEAAVPGPGGPTTGVGGPLEWDRERRYLFAGANFTWVVMQVAGELSWVSSVDPVDEVRGSGSHSSGGGGLFGAVTFRITY